MKALFMVILASMSLTIIHAQSSLENKFKYATTPAPFTVHLLKDRQPEKFIVSIDNPGKERLRLTVSGGGGRYSCQTNDESKQTLFNMSEAEDGVYTIEVKSKNHYWEKEISIVSTATEVVRKIEL